MPADWIEASRPPRVPFTNAHASALTPVVLLLVHIRWWTAGIVFATCAVIFVLSIKGRSATWLLRKAKSSLRRQRVSARPVYYRRRAQLVRSHDQVEIDLLRHGSEKRGV